MTTTSEVGRPQRRGAGWWVPSSSGAWGYYVEVNRQTARCTVVYSKRAVNAWGLVQADLRTQHEPLSRPQMGWSSLHSMPHDGLLTPLASRG
jgi:hypothetical protein